MIRDGKIGQVQEISRCLRLQHPPGDWRLNKKLAGGGPLYDVDIYSLNATRYLTGEEPAKITAVASTIDHDGRFNEVEENVAWTTIFPSGIVAAAPQATEPTRAATSRCTGQRLDGARSGVQTTKEFT